MSKTRNWPHRALYIVLALALVLGMALTPAMPAVAQSAGTDYPTIDPPNIAYNVKGATHKVCIDLNDWESSFYDGYVTIDWWLEAGPAGTVSKTDVTVIDPSGLNLIYEDQSFTWDFTIKSKGLMDNVPCIEIRANMSGDILIRAEVTLWSSPWSPEPNYSGEVVESVTRSTEKKWGEIYRSELDVDLKAPGWQPNMATVEIPKGYTGNWTQRIEDTVTATFLKVGEDSANGAIVHWWLLEDTPTNKAKIRELMLYMAEREVAEEGTGFYEDYTATGTYKPGDPEMDGKQPWQWINDYAVLNEPERGIANAPVFTIEPVDRGDDGSRRYYGWNEIVDGKAQADIQVHTAHMEPCNTYNIMIVVLVSYPGGSTAQEDPFNGENRVAVQIGQKSYHKGRTPTEAQVKTPQLRWAGEKIVLEKDWGVEPTMILSGAAWAYGSNNSDFAGGWEAHLEAVVYPALYWLELGSIGNLEPIAGETGTYTWTTWWGEEIDARDLIPGSYGAQEVITHSGGGVILSTEMSGQSDVNAAAYVMTVTAHASGEITRAFPGDEPFIFEDIPYYLEMDWITMDSHSSDVDLDGPIVNHGFLVYFLEFEDVVLSDVTPQSSIVDLEPNMDDAHVAVQVRGFFDHRNSHLIATTREEKVLYIEGEPAYILPAGRYVFPDDWWLLAGTKNVKLRPNFDLMDRAHHDSIVSEPDANLDGLESHGDYNTGVITTDPPGEARWPTVGPFSTLQPWSSEGKWITEAVVPTSLVGVPGRNTVVPDGIIDRWDAPMPPALVIFDIVAETEDASLSQLLKTDLYGYGYMLDGLGNKIYQSPYYAVEIPAHPAIPFGYPGWDSWNGGDGPYFFWTDLQLHTRWASESPLDRKDVEVYSDNHGIAAVAIDALEDLGYVTITATVDFPYTPKMGKYGPRVSDEIIADWGERPGERVNPHFFADKVEVEVGETVTFTNDTAGGTPPYLGAAWDFDGDGLSDSYEAAQTGETVTWQYDAPGLYNVSLTIQDIDETRSETRWYYITVLGENGVTPPPDDDEPGLEEGLASIADELVIVLLWQPATQSWDLYFPVTGDDTIGTMEVGRAYWIYVEADCTLEYGTVSIPLYAGWNNPVWPAQ